ncbi:serine hydrolase domain-containing protein [Kribbella sp. NPDC050281]|uniref:serine hydrolase domain-containing protein n=1 Tax=Kribbella sp. NPDC050281 TaxID=3155515 RepID=UPI0034003904
MRRALRALVAVTTMSAMVAVPAAAVAAPAKQDRAELQKQLDNVVDAVAVGAVAEVRDGHHVWRGSSGVAELGKTRAVPVSSRFRAGSITKTFLATVVLQLVDEGSLRLDDKVESWLPGVVPGGDGITVRQLLNHTSGVFDYRLTLTLPPSPEFLNYRWRTWSASELIRRAVAQPSQVDPPGSAFSYSNTNYTLLGEIVRKATGHSYADEIERRIIKPLRLRDTEMPGTSPRIRGPHPHGYLPVQRSENDVELVDFTEMNPSLFGAGGELISTTADLNRFFTALLDGQLLPRHLFDEMKTAGTETRNYGLGLSWRDTTCGIRLYGNDGDALSYQSWSFSSRDGRHQVTIAVTPTFKTDPDAAVDNFLNKAICG